VLDGFVAAIEGTMGSPWFYVALCAIVALDAFFPAVPGETLVISAGVFAASTGEPNVVVVAAVAAAGAFIGDHISYVLGRRGGGLLLGRFGRNAAVHGAVGRVRRALDVRGGVVLVTARYVPGGRTAATLTCGATGYPLRKFSPFDAIATVSWGAYSAAIGYLAGTWFEGDPIRGLLLGIGFALATAAAVEGVRYLRKRRRLLPTEPGSRSAQRDRAEELT
jgi:membrane-associated protein